MLRTLSGKWGVIEPAHRLWRVLLGTCPLTTTDKPLASFHLHIRRNAPPHSPLAGLDGIVLIEKLMGQLKFFSQMRTQCLNAELFGGVMSGGDKGYAALLR